MKTAACVLLALVATVDPVTVRLHLTDGTVKDGDAVSRDFCEHWIIPAFRDGRWHPEGAAWVECDPIDAPRPRWDDKRGLVQ